MEIPLNPNIPHEREMLRRLFRIKRIEGEMMKDRGYSLDEVNLFKTDLNFTMPVSLSFLQDPFYPFEQFLEYRQKNNVFQVRQEFSSIYVNRANGQIILVLYLNNEPGKAVSAENFKIVHYFISKQYHNMVLITETGLGPDSLNFIRQNPNYNFEVFLDRELAFNPLKHSLAPIVIRYIPAEQVPEWAKSEGLESEVQRLPMMLDIDPIAKWYGAKPYDVFQTYLLGTEHDMIGYYRIVRQTPPVKKTTKKVG